MSAEEMIEELAGMPEDERWAAMKAILTRLYPGAQNNIDRLMRRRIENPDVPEDVWRGIEEAENGRLVDMETALTQKPPWLE